MIHRYIQNDIFEHIQAQKVVVVYGPRRVGKTTLLRQLGAEIREPILWLAGETLDTREELSTQSIERLRGVVGHHRMVIIDEAQYIDHIGLNLKIMVDHIPGIKIIATGSSSFELANQVGEPLVGRTWTYNLYPIAQLELSAIETPFESRNRLESRLVYGSYPEVINAPGVVDKAKILESIIDGVLFKDIFILEKIKKPQKVISLAKMLALQIGGQVSLSELSRSLEINIGTVEHYLDLLEKTFIIRRVFGFSRNLRKEITKTCRYYFWDNGIRNVLINNFNPLTVRSDVGQLWENYLFIEREKKREYQRIHSNIYFWRTHDRQEIDLVEERDGKVYGFEFKWGKKIIRSPRDWKKTYPESDFSVINQENYLEFVG